LGFDVLVAGIEVTEMPFERVDLVEREVPLATVMTLSLLGVASVG
jgi:hypothetical protein